MKYNCLFYFGTLRLEIWHVCIKNIIRFLGPADYMYAYQPSFGFFRSLKRLGSVLSRSELDPFLYIWYHTAPTQKRA